MKKYLVEITKTIQVDAKDIREAHLVALLNLRMAGRTPIESKINR